MANFDCVFFDSGGTLYGDGGEPTRKQVAEGAGRRAAAMLGAFGADVDLKTLTAAVEECEAGCRERLGAGYSYRHLMMAAAERLHLAIGPEEAACIADAYAGPRYASWLFPGTREMLRALSDAGLYLGVIANTPWPGFTMDRAFAGVGLLQFFSIRIYSCEVGIEKPDPRIFRLAEEISGRRGRRILYVGDSLDADIKGAKSVGWRAAMRTSKGPASGGLADFEFAECSEFVRFVLGD